MIMVRDASHLHVPPALPSTPSCVKEHGMVEQSLADVLSLRGVCSEALTNRMKQLQTV